MKKEYISSRRYTLNKEEIDRAIKFYLDHEKCEILTDMTEIEYGIDNGELLSVQVVTIDKIDEADFKSDLSKKSS